MLFPFDEFQRAKCVSFVSLACLLGLVLPGCGRRQPAESTPVLASPVQSAAVVSPVSMVRDPAETDSETRTNRVASPPLAGDWFEDVTAASGVSFQYHNGQESGHFYILESLGGGAGILDYDRDGNLDILLTGGGTIAGAPPRIAGLPSALFRNSGQLRFLDVTQHAGLATAGDYSHGCFTTDFDCDGCADLLVTAYGRCRLFRNQGDGTFADVSASAAVHEPGWWTAAAWGDVDGDGLPDLLVTGYLKWTPETDQSCWNSTGQREVCSPTRFLSADDRCYRNRGDGTFEDITSRAGLVAGGNGLGVVAAEINGDGIVDFYVANDETDNFLYIGGASGTLEEVGYKAGVAVNQYGNQEGSMGVDAGDYDGDGQADLWVTNFELEDNALYRNLGNMLFSQTTNLAGLAGCSRLQVGFGTALEDFNGDGWLDLVVVNGHVFYAGGQLPYRQKSQLFRNSADGRFEDVSLSGGDYFRVDHSGRGAAVVDLNNDGGQDLVIVHQNEPVSILKNRFPAPRFISLELIGTQSDRDAVGAVVSVKTEGHKRVRLQRSGAGYLSQFDRRILLPISTESAEVEVRWPGGTTEIFRDVPAGRTYALIQGRGVKHVPE